MKNLLLIAIAALVVMPSWYAQARTTVDPIFIDDDAANDWADCVSNGPCTGGPGTNYDNRYKIHSVEIDADDGDGTYCIKIQNSDVHFEISDVWLQDATYSSWPNSPGAGIVLINVSEDAYITSDVDLSYTYGNYIGVVLYNTDNAYVDTLYSLGNTYGMYLSGSDSNDVVDSYLYYNSSDGVHLYDSDSNNFNNCTLTYNDYGAYLSASNGNDFYNGSAISHNDVYGLYYYNSDSSWVRVCTFDDNQYYGVYLSSYTDGNDMYINNFIDNNSEGTQAYDVGSNDWHGTWDFGCWDEGNYWDEMDCGNIGGGCFDQCSNDYSIAGSAGAEDTAPQAYEFP